MKKEGGEALELWLKRCQIRWTLEVREARLLDAAVATAAAAESPQGTNGCDCDPNHDEAL